MAVAFSANLGTANTGVTSAQTLAKTIAVQANVGDVLIVCSGCSGASAPGNWSITDNSVQAGAANVYTKDVEGDNSGNEYVAIFSCPVTRNILTTNSVTVRYDNSNTSRTRGIFLFTVTGITTGSGLDKFSSNSNAGSNTYSTGALAATSLNDMICVAMGGFGSSSSCTPQTNGQGTSMTERCDLATGSARTWHVETCAETRQLSYTMTGQWAASSSWAAAGAVYGNLPATITPVASMSLSQAVKRSYYF